jgi:hypothetical protein
MAHGHGHRKGCKCGFCTKSHRHTKRKRKGGKRRKR